MLALRAAREIWGEREQCSTRCLYIGAIGKADKDAICGGDFLVQGVLAPRKWLVQPESAVDRVWGAVTRELKVRLLITMSL